MENQEISSDVNLNNLARLEYGTFNEMMCIKNNQLDNVAYTFGPANLKTFISMKRNVSRWFNLQSKENKMRILNFIKQNSN